MPPAVSHHDAVRGRLPAGHPVTATLTLALANFAGSSHQGGWEPLLDAAVAADRAGVDRVVVVDHVVLGGHLDRYDGGHFPTGPDGPWLEPLTVLGVVAGRTTRIRLATGILIAPLRPAAILAKAAATLDVLSSGRLELGLGLGWQREEYDACGVPFDRRGALLDRTVVRCRELWAPGDAPLDPDRPGERIWCVPKPRQEGGVPLWFGGRLTPPNLARLVRWGSGWLPWVDFRDDVGPGIDLLHRSLDRAGRDPASMAVRHRLPVVTGPDGLPDPDATVAPVPDLLARGVTDCSIGVSLPPDLDDATAALRALVEAFRAATN